MENKGGTGGGGGGMGFIMSARGACAPIVVISSTWMRTTPKRRCGHSGREGGKDNAIEAG